MLRHLWHVTCSFLHLCIFKGKVIWDISSRKSVFSETICDLLYEHNVEHLYVCAEIDQGFECNRKEIWSCRVFPV